MCITLNKDQNPIGVYFFDEEKSAMGTITKDNNDMADEESEGQIDKDEYEQEEEESGPVENEKESVTEVEEEKSENKSDKKIDKENVKEKTKKSTFKSIQPNSVFRRSYINDPRVIVVDVK